MNKIEFTEKEIEVVQLYIDRKIDHYTMTEEQSEILFEIGQRADKYMEENGLEDDVLEDSFHTMQGWYYEKYLEQQKGE